MRLDLHDNPITGEVAPHLADLLRSGGGGGGGGQPALKALVLNDTSLGDDGVSVVCAALAGAAPALEVRACVCECVCIVLYV